MKPIDPREALALYADDARYAVVCRHLHPTVDGSVLAINDDADNELLAMVTLAALGSGKSVMVVATPDGHHCDAVNQVDLVARACARQPIPVRSAKFTVVWFDTVAAAA